MFKKKFRNLSAKLLNLVWLILAFGLTNMQVASAETEELPFRQNPPHLVFDMNTGAVLSSNRPFERWAPASLTKMMTAYTVFRAIELQHLSMQSPVEITQEAAQQPPSRLGLPVGSILTIENALKIIMVKSANDVSVALAQAVTGDEETFVSLMNSHVRRLGLTDTRFANSHGLHDPLQHTTAKDMAMLTRIITDEYNQWASFFDIPAVRVGKRRLRNHNALLRNYAGTTGMKTGYVCASGFNVAVRVKRETAHIGAVVFGWPSGRARNAAAAQLLQNGFDRASQDAYEVSRLDELQRPEGLSETLTDITNQVCPGKYAFLHTPAPRPSDAPSLDDFARIDTVVSPEDIVEQEAQPEIAPLPTKRPKVFLVERFAELPKAASASQALLSQLQSAYAEPVETPTVSAGKAAALAIEKSLSPAIPEADRPPSLSSTGAVLLKRRTDLRDDEVIELGGATGPNPFGIKLTDGNRYRSDS